MRINFLFHFLQILTMIDEYSLIPPKAFLYFPPYQRMVQYPNQQKMRVIFGGNIDFDEDEKQKIQQLRQRIRQNTKNKQLQDCSDNLLLRYYQGAQFNLDAAIKSLEEYIAWQRKTLPLIINTKIEGLLKQGILYVCGRDCYYRPIIIVNAKKILDLQIDKSDLTDCLSYFFEFVVENILIEGQIEQWIIIIDLGNASVFSLGKSMLDIISHLSSIFKVRAVRNYLINCPSSIKFLWGALKNVLNQDQIRKISMSTKKVLKPTDFQQINPLQIEIKYGGNYPNTDQYWPLHLNSNSVEVKSVNVRDHMVTQNQYDEMFNNGQLKNRKIKKDFIQKYKNLKKNEHIELQLMTQKDQDEENQGYKQSWNGFIDNGHKISYESQPPENYHQSLPTLEFQDLF